MRAQDPQGAQRRGETGCTISASLPGIDPVFEGEAQRVANTPTLAAVAAVYREGGWPVQVDGDAFTAPCSALSSGPPPWHVFRLTAHTVFVVAAAEPHGATLALLRARGALAAVAARITTTI